VRAALAGAGLPRPSRFSNATFSVLEKHARENKGTQAGIRWATEECLLNLGIAALRCLVLPGQLHPRGVKS